MRRVGGNESKGLALKGADGKDYTFRSVNKDMSDIVPVEFQDSVLVDIVQDQIAGTFPGVQVVIPPLAKAVGLLSVDRASLVLLPDDPILGEFQKEFAGVFGTFLEYPQPRSNANPGFYGATEILGPDEFWDLRQKSPEAQPDTRAFLRARLLVIFLNDWDRHRRQWRWARIPGQPQLQPIAEDPDMVFSDYEGAAISIARFMGAPFVKFEDEYPPLSSVNKNGWDVDRFLLTDIEKSEWMTIAADVQAKLTDSVIDDALHRMPPEYFRLRGAEMVARLKNRRDALVQYAEHYYESMAKDVDVQGSDVAEIASLKWIDQRELEVTVSRLNQDGTAADPYYRRRFKSDETSEVRVYLHGGNDKVVARGQGKGIKVRVVGGSGDDTVDNSEGTRVRFYDSEGDNRVEGDRGTSLDKRSFTMPSRPLPNDVPWVPNPDWGRVNTPIIALGYASDPGLIVGGGINSQGRGFRKYPWADSHQFEAAWAFGASKPFVDYTGAFRRQNSDILFSLNARFSGIEQLRYYGLGNETEFDTDRDDIYDISDFQTEIFPALTIDLGSRNYFAVGPYLQYSDSGGTDSDTVLGQQQPLGFGKFGQIGLKADFAFDSRTEKDVFAKGFEVRAGGKYFFPAWDVEDSFGSVNGRVAAHLPMGQRLVWNLFVGGEKVWGDFPFFEAAYIDNRTTTGYSWNRFAGDASLYGGVEVDLILKTMRATVPGDFGVSFFTDAGRVFLEGEDSGKWHPSYGMGVFYAPFERTSLYGLKFGKDEDKWFVVIEARMSGFTF